MVYKVIGKEETFKVLTLAEAMNIAKHMNEFVRIVGKDFEIVGIFGVDEVKDPNYDGWISRKKDNMSV
jgi:hypothetical protein